MIITLEIPEQLAAHFGQSSQEVARHAWEAFLLETYRQDKISGAEAAQILGYSRMQWEMFLDEHQVVEGTYSTADLERDLAASAKAIIG
jgi:predicted HTH domain antitoxin